MIFSGRFSNNFLSKPEFFKDPRKWWKSWEEYPELKELSQYVQRLFSISPTSASVERNFSLQPMTHSEERNRLGHDTIEKLMVVKSHIVFKLGDQLSEDTASDTDESEFQLVSID